MSWRNALCRFYKEEPRARLNGARSGTRVDSGMRYTCYNSPGAVITHDTASTVESRAWAELLFLFIALDAPTDSQNFTFSVFKS